jgi:hypothetical protein
VTARTWLKSASWPADAGRPLLTILVVLMLGHKKTADAHY